MQARDPGNVCRCTVLSEARAVGPVVSDYQANDSLRNEIPRSLEMAVSASETGFAPPQ